MKLHFRTSQLFAALFVSGFGLAATGCGGGSSPAPAPAVSNNLAPNSISGHTMVFVDPEQSQFSTTFVFTGGNYTSPSGDSGSFTYVPVTGTTTQATLKIVSSFSPALTYNLTFTSASGGTYINQTSQTGTFTYQ